MHQLEHTAAAHRLIQPPRRFAHRSLVPFRQHHPFRPCQHRPTVLVAAPQLPANGLPPVATAVEADVVLVEIGGAGHHDQRGRRRAGIRTAGGLHQRLHRATGPVFKAMQLMGPARRNTGQQPSTEQGPHQPRTPGLEPMAPLPPASGQEQQQGGQQGSDVAVAFVGAQRGEHPGRHQIDQEPAPGPGVIGGGLPALPAPKQQPRQAHHQKHRAQLLRQQARVPQPTGQAEHAGIPFPGRRLEHGPVGAAEAGDPVVTQPGADQCRREQGQQQGLPQPRATPPQRDSRSPESRRNKHQQGALLHQHRSDGCQGATPGLPPAATALGIAPDPETPDRQAATGHQGHLQHVVRAQIQKGRRQCRQQAGDQGQAIPLQPPSPARHHHQEQPVPETQAPGRLLRGITTQGHHAAVHQRGQGRNLR